MAEPSKNVKRLLRKYASIAHEEELRRELTRLDAAFEKWKKGDMMSGELTDFIHQFHQGPARELFLRYNTGMLDMAVASAIVKGILDKNQVPPEVLDYLSKAISFFEEEKSLGVN